MRFVTWNHSKCRSKHSPHFSQPPSPRQATIQTKVRLSNFGTVRERPEASKTIVNHSPSRQKILCLSLLLASLPTTVLPAQLPESNKPIEWKSVSFAIVRFNDEAPKSWNIYHTSKRGILLVKLWKRFLLVNIPEQQVFDIDPGTVKTQGDNVEWATSDTPSEPLEITEWKERNVGPVQRVRFRLSKTGHILELQLPLRPDGKPAY